jgi:hypothetical protein
MRAIPRQLRAASLWNENAISGVAVLTMEASMPVILWWLGVPLVVVIALMLFHVI